MSRILIAGSRDYTDYNNIRNFLVALSSDTVIITGGCRGADSIAEFVAKQLKMTVEVFPAEWKKYGRSAGPKRNLKMIKEGKPDKVIIFHSNINESKGSKNMKQLAEYFKIPVTVLP